ncbi:methylthioribulose 1-phosphate dehydratase [Cyanobacterium aponinum]|uniref:Methylthioribulose-1-phosphate dehydratase n=1 Tax=Cyanobacterium aponinum (strain PCC 10605) TaxID=755178 RepID=K9Z9Y9_CYAAP|nr:methylthioribulose 1-phosphate dehydratase [Cyanobacterium aponinum]AFZ55405.1 methylthioribulose-1-phosphate dehydratase [Cyanobacterium aponinum PCC 10605]
MVYSQFDFDQACQSIISTANYLYSQGWTPATSSNFSQKLDNNYCAITVSGKDKGRLIADDIMIVDFEGKPQTNQKPSAETLLHTSLYGWNDTIGAVLHTHSLNTTLISLLTNNNILQLEGYELLKAFSGISTHENAIAFPIFENTQDIANLAQEVINYLNTDVPCWGYLIKGHGVYTWGEDMASALRHLEAIEYLMKCELEIMRIKGRK